MSDIAANTTIIENKKENNSDGFKPDFKAFLKNYFKSLFITITLLIFIIGALGLYTSKIAMSNILPDDITLAPFTNKNWTSGNKEIDVHISGSYFSDQFSQKATFDSNNFLGGFDNNFICFLKNIATDKNSMFANIALYLTKVYQNLMTKNFWAINSFFFYFNYLPETLVMLLYGFFGIFVWLGLFGLNICLSIFFHLVSIPHLFRKWLNEDDDKDLTWESDKDLSFFRIKKLILFFFIWGPIGLISTFVSPAFFTFYGLLAPLFAEYEIKDFKKTDKEGKTIPFNVIDYLFQNFVSKKLFYFILATISLFSNASKYLGKNGIYGVAISVVFAYFMGLYSSESLIEGTNGFQKYLQETIEINNKKTIETEFSLNHCKNNIIIDGDFNQTNKPTIQKNEQNDSDTPTMQENEQNGSNNPTMEQKKEEVLYDKIFVNNDDKFNFSNPMKKNQTDTQDLRIKTIVENNKNTNPLNLKTNNLVRNNIKYTGGGKTKKKFQNIRIF
jgi:hypothetical protein